MVEWILTKALLTFTIETRTGSPHQHGPLLRRYCLSDLLVFEKMVPRKMDESRTARIIFPDFAKALSVFLSNSRRRGYQRGLCE